MNEEIKKILQLELEKCIKIYCFEYCFELLPIQEVSVYESKTDDGQINQEPEINARGGPKGIKVYAGIQKELDTKLSSK